MIEQMAATMMILFCAGAYQRRGERSTSPSGMGTALLASYAWESRVCPEAPAHPAVQLALRQPHVIVSSLLIPSLDGAHPMVVASSVRRARNGLEARFSLQLDEVRASCCSGSLFYPSGSLEQRKHCKAMSG